MTDWLVEGLMPMGHAILLLGQPHSCKSWFDEQLSVCVATGEKFLGDEGLTVAKGSVILVDEDTPTDTLMTRMRRICKAYKCKLEDLPITIKSMESFRLSDEKQVQELIRDIYRLTPPVLVVLDSLSNIVGNWEEDKSSGARKVTSTWEEIKATGATLLIPHHLSLKKETSHTEWDFTGKAMGNTQLIAKCDTAIGLWRVPTKKETKFIVKAKERRTALTVNSSFAVRLCEDKPDGEWAYLIMEEQVPEQPSKQAKRIFPIFYADKKMNQSVESLMRLLRRDMGEIDLRAALHELEDHRVLVRDVRGQSHRFEYSLNPDFDNPLIPEDLYWESLI